MQKEIATLRVVVENDREGQVTRLQHDALTTEWTLYINQAADQRLAKANGNVKVGTAIRDLFAHELGHFADLVFRSQGEMLARNFLNNLAGPSLTDEVRAWAYARTIKPDLDPEVVKYALGTYFRAMRDGSARP